VNKNGDLVSTDKEEAKVLGGLGGLVKCKDGKYLCSMISVRKSSIRTRGETRL